MVELFFCKQGEIEWNLKIKGKFFLEIAPAAAAAYRSSESKYHLSLFLALCNNFSQTRELPRKMGHIHFSLSAPLYLTPLNEN